MPEITTLRKPADPPLAIWGDAPLSARRRYLRRRNRRIRVNSRALAVVWVGVGAAVSWVFVVGFTVLAH